MHEFRDDGYFYVVEGSCVVLDEMFIMHNFNSFHKWPLNLIETGRPSMQIPAISGI